jgi:hypothetical protein
MRRAIAATALLLTVAAATTGCGAFSKDQELSTSLEYHLAVTGGAAEKITYSVPRFREKNFEENEAAPALPWTKAGITWPGVLTVVVTPTSGAATCRIEVEKKELAKVEGKPGAPVTCTAKIKKQG